MSLTNIQIPVGKLELNTTYKVRVRYKGQEYGWSEWSEKEFTTSECVLFSNAANFTRSTIFCTAVGEDVIKVNDNMGVTPTDQNSSIQWGCSGTSTGADSDTDGASNTSTILSNCSARPIAASICADYGDGNWYLPAENQLWTLYQNRSNINSASDANFVTTSYWSSTEHSATDARGVSFLNGSQGTVNKTTTIRVRCVRSFGP